MRRLGSTLLDWGAVVDGLATDRGIDHVDEGMPAHGVQLHEFLQHRQVVERRQGALDGGGQRQDELGFGIGRGRVARIVHVPCVGQPALRLPLRNHPANMSALLLRLAEARKEGNVARLAEAIPYARWMQIAPENGTGELLTRTRYHPELIGNTFLPAIHGGTLGAMLEMAAIFHLLWETETETVPKIVNITVAYLRSARPVDVIACAKVTKQGRRMVNVFAEAWQEDRSRPVATANAHFLVKSDADAPPSL